MRTLAVILGLILINGALAGQDSLDSSKGLAQSSHNYVDWFRDSCYEYSSSGSYIQTLSPDACRDFKGSYYSIFGTSCYEFTSKGVYLQTVGTEKCENSRNAIGNDLIEIVGGDSYVDWYRSKGRRERGVYVDWYGRSCYEYAARGSYIQTLKSDVCREIKGNYYSWYGESCYEYTSKGVYIQTVSTQYCR